jgi:hypothetical protein
MTYRASSGEWIFPFQTSYINCKVLLDTGFQKGFVRLRSSADVFRLPRTGTEKSLEGGTTVHIGFGDPAINSEDFTVASGPSGSGATPDNNIHAVYSTRLPRFVNTGSHVFGDTAFKRIPKRHRAARRGEVLLWRGRHYWRTARLTHRLAPRCPKGRANALPAVPAKKDPAGGRSDKLHDKHLAQCIGCRIWLDKYP